MSGARFFVLDGIDGCGKSTQALELVRALDARAPAAARAPALHLREPGSTAAGEHLRALLLAPEPSLAPATQALLFCAARRQMLEELVRPALAAGRDVVCERFHPSTYAYQGCALGVGAEAVLVLVTRWAGEPAPDLTVILDLDPEEARARRGRADRFEAREADFHRRVAEGYRRYAREVERVVLVSAAGSRAEVGARVWNEVHRAGR